MGGGGTKIDPAKMEAILKCFIPTNAFEVRSFVGVTQYLRKFIASFLVVTTSLHAILISDESS